MNGLVIFLIILLIVIILAGLAVVIWYFFIRKKDQPTPSGGTGPSNGGGNNGGGTNGGTGPNAVSYLLDARNYNAFNFLDFNSVQGTNSTPMGSISGGIWTAGVTGSYLVFADATNNGGGGSIYIAKNANVIGRQALPGSVQTTLKTMGYANLIPGDSMAVITAQQISITDPDPKQEATSHFIIERVNNAVTYLANGGSFTPNAVINYSTPQQGTDPIGSISNGIWSPNTAGNYLVFADATNDNGGATLSILRPGFALGTAFKTLATSQTATVTISTMGYATLAAGETLFVTTASGMTITNSLTAATCHLMILKVDPGTVASYLFSSAQPNLQANSILQYSLLQGGSDSLGTMSNGIWNCRSPGKYLIYADATNDGGGGAISITAQNTIIGTGYASDFGGQGTISTMGYAQLNANDNVAVVTLTGLNITSPDPAALATCHLIIHKIN